MSRDLLLLFLFADDGLLSLVAWWRSNANISRQAGDRRRLVLERREVRRALLRLGWWRSLWLMLGSPR